MGSASPPQLRLSLGDMGDSFGGSLVDTAAYTGDLGTFAGSDTTASPIESGRKSGRKPDDGFTFTSSYGQIDPTPSLVEDPVPEEYETDESDADYESYYDDPSIPLHQQQRGATQQVLENKRARSHFSIPDVVITADEADGGEHTYEVRLADADRRSILFLPEDQAALDEALRPGQAPSTSSGPTPASASLVSSSSSGSLTTGPAGVSAASASSPPASNGSAQSQQVQPAFQRPGRPLISLAQDESDPNIRALNGALNDSIRGSTYTQSPVTGAVGADASTTPSSITAAPVGAGPASASSGRAQARTTVPTASPWGDRTTSPPLQPRRGSGDAGAKEKKTKRSPLGFLLLGKKNRSSTLPSLPALDSPGQGSSAPFPSSTPSSSSAAPTLPPLQISNGHRSEGSPTSPEGGGFWSTLADQSRTPSHPTMSSDETSSSFAQVNSPPLDGPRQPATREGSGSTLASEPSKPPSRAEKKAVEKERKARIKAEQALVKELASLDKIVKAHDAKQAKEGAKQAKALAKARKNAPSSHDLDADLSGPVSPPLPKQKSGLSRFSIFGKKGGKKDGKVLEPGLPPIPQVAALPSSLPPSASNGATPPRAGRPAASKSPNGSLRRSPSSGMGRSTSTRRALAALEQRNRAERGHGSGLSRSSLSASASVRRAGSRKGPGSRVISPSRTPSHPRLGSGASSSLRGSPKAAAASGDAAGTRALPEWGAVVSSTGPQGHMDGAHHAVDDGWAEADWVEEDEDAGSSDDDVDRGRSLDLQRRREKAEVRKAERAQQQAQAALARVASAPATGADTTQSMVQGSEDQATPRAKSPALARKPVPVDEPPPSARAASSTGSASPSSPPAPAMVSSSSDPVVGPMGRLRNTAQQELDRFVFPRAPQAGARA